MTSLTGRPAGVQIEPGSRPLELCVPSQRYLDELAQHGIAIVPSQVQRDTTRAGG